MKSCKPETKQIIRQATRDHKIFDLIFDKIYLIKYLEEKAKVWKRIRATHKKKKKVLTLISEF
jgi:cobalamin biosynthesis protein CobT